MYKFGMITTDNKEVRKTMANIKSQIKRIATSEKARIRNASAKSAARTAVKKVRVAVEAKDLANAIVLCNEAYALLDKLVVKGSYAKNTVARKKAEIAKLVDSIR